MTSYDCVNQPRLSSKDDTLAYNWQQNCVNLPQHFLVLLWSESIDMMLRSESKSVVISLVIYLFSEYSVVDRHSLD